ncbi:hypothetical protein ROZALSC1DRAFT_24070 [Rozella allomycis CSF55]|uniref:Uncharacterized protein n=1 Tax=Rozella allomycis (strain CSF55) TaxID=988480 RepID=A0A4P9YDW9_ROZAC|nr:hypothetical protein ROZALSC1DRAFT_24070 [Rozella allomycis CSF55]
MSIPEALYSGLAHSKTRSLRHARMFTEKAKIPFRPDCIMKNCATFVKLMKHLSVMILWLILVGVFVNGNMSEGDEEGEWHDGGEECVRVDGRGVESMGRGGGCEGRDFVVMGVRMWMHGCVRESEGEMNAMAARREMKRLEWVLKAAQVYRVEVIDRMRAEEFAQYVFLLNCGYLRMLMDMVGLGDSYSRGMSDEDVFYDIIDRVDSDRIEKLYYFLRNRDLEVDYGMLPKDAMFVQLAVEKRDIGLFRIVVEDMPDYEMSDSLEIIFKEIYGKEYLDDFLKEILHEFKRRGAQLMHASSELEEIFRKVKGECFNSLRLEIDLKSCMFIERTIDFVAYDLKVGTDKETFELLAENELYQMIRNINFEFNVDFEYLNELIDRDRIRVIKALFYSHEIDFTKFPKSDVIGLMKRMEKIDSILLVIALQRWTYIYELYLEVYKSEHRILTLIRRQRESEIDLAYEDVLLETLKIRFGHGNVDVDKIVDAMKVYNVEICEFHSLMSGVGIEEFQEIVKIEEIERFKLDDISGDVDEGDGNEGDGDDISGDDRDVDQNNVVDEEQDEGIASDIDDTESDSDEDTLVPDERDTIDETTNIQSESELGGDSTLVETENNLMGSLTEEDLNNIRNDFQSLREETEKSCLDEDLCDDFQFKDPRSILTPIPTIVNPIESPIDNGYYSADEYDDDSGYCSDDPYPKRNVKRKVNIKELVDEGIDFSDSKEDKVESVLSAVEESVEDVKQSIPIIEVPIEVPIEKIKLSIEEIKPPIEEIEIIPEPKESIEEIIPPIIDSVTSSFPVVVKEEEEISNEIKQSKSKRKLIEKLRNKRLKQPKKPPLKENEKAGIKIKKEIQSKEINYLKEIKEPKEFIKSEASNQPLKVNLEIVDFSSQEKPSEIPINKLSNKFTKKKEKKTVKVKTKRKTEKPFTSPKPIPEPPKESPINNHSEKLNIPNTNVTTTDDSVAIVLSIVTGASSLVMAASFFLSKSKRFLAYHRSKHENFQDYLSRMA